MWSKPLKELLAEEIRNPHDVGVNCNFRASINWVMNIINNNTDFILLQIPFFH